MKYIPGLIAILLLIGIVACEDETKNCDQTLVTDVGVNFKKDSLDGYINKDTAWPKVVLCALDKDTLISRQKRSSIFFTLDPLHDTSKYYLQLDSAAQADTLTFMYKRDANFISPGCGFATTFILDTVLTTYHTIDSLHINFKQVNSSNDTHVSLYFIY